jgi:hypothetical protein
MPDKKKSDKASPWNRKAYHKAYRLKHKEKISAQKRDYYKRKKKELTAYKLQWKKDNPKKYKAMLRKYYVKNKERIQERESAYYQENREERLAYSREYKRAHPEKILEIQRRCDDRKREHAHEQAKFLLGITDKEETNEDNSTRESLANGGGCRDEDSGVPEGRGQAGSSPAGQEGA